MKVLIVEDEPMARDNFAGILRKSYPDMDIVGMTGSVAETVAWLRANSPDVIFMDVELSDGNCFEIFRQIDVDAKVVMTTAYDNYAVKAFEVNSVDYLLKPIDKDALDRAVERCRKADNNSDIKTIINALGHKDEYRSRFMVKMNDKILPVAVEDIAFFISEDKITWMYLRDGSHQIMDLSLDVLSTQLNPSSFFRISRSCIISMSAVKSIVKLPGGRLRLNTTPSYTDEISVSRARVDDFLGWMDR